MIKYKKQQHKLQQPLSLEWTVCLLLHLSCDSVHVETPRSFLTRQSLSLALTLDL